MENLRGDLEVPRYEVLPFKSIDREAEYLPEEAQVTVTCSPKLGVDATLDVAEKLSQRGEGIDVIPHLPAREIEGSEHLKQILHRMGEAGMNGAFIVGGDRKEPAGEYDRSLRLIEAIRNQGSDIILGITGYPEGHNDISPEDLMKDMLDKQGEANYVATQLCYDSEAILNWVEESRSQGLELPVEVSVPGSTDIKKLIRISAAAGVGDSAKYLQKTNGLMAMATSLFRSNDHWVNKLTTELAPALNNDQYNVSGFHIATFNDIEGTEKWRQRKLNKLPKSK